MWKTKLKQFFIQFCKFIPVAVAIASVVTALSPNPSQEDTLKAAHQVLDIIAVHFFHSSPCK